MSSSVCTLCGKWQDRCECDPVAKRLTLKVNSLRAELQRTQEERDAYKSQATDLGRAVLNHAGLEMEIARLQGHLNLADEARLAMVNKLDRMRKALKAVREYANSQIKSIQWDDQFGSATVNGTNNRMERVIALVDRALNPES